MASEHIIKSYDDELQRLTNTITEMGGMAETQIAAATQAVMKRDSELAANIIEADSRVDKLETEVGTMAVRQPMARDLREILAALKIAGDLERICDYAANVAKRSIALKHVPPAEPIFALPRMANLARSLTKDVIDAYVARDAEKALVVWARDEELDEMYSGLFRELLTYMMEDPRNIAASTHLLFVAKNIERIGDHATNIAETVYFLVHGKRLNEARPKGDRSIAMLDPPVAEAIRGSERS